MSNAQPDTRGAGGERRKRRSRGGRGRNRNRQDEQGNNSSPQSRGERGERGERRERTHGGHNRGERNQNRGERGDRDERGPRPPRKEFKPAPLKWWQKLLKAIGLYKEPVRPPRPERKESVRFEEGPPSGNVIPTAAAPREVKSNTRNARQPGAGAEGGAPPRERERDRDRDRDRERRSERSERSERTEVSGSRIYLGNLSYDTTEEDLKDLFKGVGTVRNVEIVYNRRTHKSKGYGFVDMLNTEEAKRCVEVLHDQFFMGRKLVVSGAKSKEHEEALREEIVEREPRAAAATVATAAVVAPPVAVEEAAPVAEAAPVEETTPLVEAAPVEDAPAPEPVAEAEAAPAPVAENEEQKPDSRA